MSPSFPICVHCDEEIDFVTDEARLLHEIRDLLAAIWDRLPDRADNGYSVKLDGDPE